MIAPARHRARRTRHHRGFTLIEAALATIIVGVGVLALLAAQQAFHRKNMWSTHASTATWLANEIREMTLNLPRHDPVTGREFWGPEPNEFSVLDYNDLDDFDGAIFSAELANGPINAQRQIIPNMAGWTQIIRVYNVPANNITAGYDPNLLALTDTMVVEVTVEYQGPHDTTPWEVITMSWLAPQ